LSDDYFSWFRFGLVDFRFPSEMHCLISPGNFPPVVSAVRREMTTSSITSAAEGGMYVCLFMCMDTSILQQVTSKDNVALLSV
jgi:hypothetical protein